MPRIRVPVSQPHQSLGTLCHSPLLVANREHHGVCSGPAHGFCLLGVRLKAAPCSQSLRINSQYMRRT